MFTKPQRLESLDESHPIKEKEEKKNTKKQITINSEVFLKKKKE